MDREWYLEQAVDEFSVIDQDLDGFPDWSWFYLLVYAAYNDID
jgi:hypothetical protein